MHRGAGESVRRLGGMGQVAARKGEEAVQQWLSLCGPPGLSSFCRFVDLERRRYREGMRRITAPISSGVRRVKELGAVGVLA